MEYSDYADKIKDYCEQNQLDFSKVGSMVRGCGADDIIFQYYDRTKGTEGLRDETRMPVVLIIKREGNALLFEQTEHTRKYLS
ncbi:MAG: hypothetical protein J1F11_04825 [Oscillospiraceae bacterium]|nr:hypothetical protein [Oscillospiraceae bacterium]